MIEPLPMMQRLIAANIQLSICFTAVEHPGLWPLECNQPESQSTTWTAIILKAVTSFWAQLTAAGSNTEIKPHLPNKCFQLCNCVAAMAAGL
jgi:hypothetical protein